MFENKYEIYRLLTKIFSSNELIYKISQSMSQEYVLQSERRLTFPLSTFLYLSWC